MLFHDIRFGLRTAFKARTVTGLAVTCLAIGYVPARRAMAVDPLVALRAE